MTDAETKLIGAAIWWRSRMAIVRSINREVATVEWHRAQADYLEAERDLISAAIDVEYPPKTE